MKRTKRMKILSTLITAALLFTAAAPAFASDADKMQEVLLSVKSRIGSTDEFKTFENNVQETKSGTTYSFYWRYPKDNSNKDMHITASQSGLITDYYYYDGTPTYSDKPNFNQISVEEAVSRTQVLIDSLNPEISGKVAVISEGVTQNLYRSGFSFSLQRYENGIKVMNNSGYVLVNADATKIISFNLSYNESLTFPAHDAVMSKEDAQKIYGEEIGMTLEYKANYDYKSRTRTVTPVYIPTESDKYINAVTGEIEKFTYDDNIMYANMNSMSGEGSSAKEEAMADNARMSEAEMTEYENLEGLKTKDELIQIVKSNPYTPISEDMSLSWYNTSKSYYEDLYTASLAFENTSGSYKYTNVSLNMKTGEILSFYRDEEMDIQKSKDTANLTDEEIKLKKEKAVSDLAGEKAKEYKFDEKSNNYIRYVNDIPYRRDSINVSVSEITGEIRSYNISYSNINFPALDGIITKDTATAQLFNQVGYYYCYAKMGSSDTEAKLIYVLEENKPTTIEAFSGKLLGASNEEYIPEIFEGYTDISDHYAEDIINTLAKFGIYFEGTECKPNEAIKQKDFIALLVSTFKSRNSIILKADEAYANEYSTALRENIIMPEEENADEAVTRELAAKYMIRAMEIDEIASIPDIYVCPFNDVTSLKGHIAILNGLKIINGDGNGNFNPNNILTRADAMILIYNYLSR